MIKKDLVNLNVKIPLALRENMENFVKKSTHINLSDLTRDALRDKIQRNTPALHEELSEKGEKTNA